MLLRVVAADSCFRLMFASTAFLNDLSGFGLPKTTPCSAGGLAGEFWQRLAASWETGRDAPLTRRRDGALRISLASSSLWSDSVGWVRN